jgi:hypothetical protein
VGTDGTAQSFSQAVKADLQGKERTRVALSDQLDC